jgi:hypothetical protein
MQIVLGLAGARSGTKALAGILRDHLSSFTVRHEPFGDPRNPVLQGRPIYDRAVGDEDRIASLLERKAGRIRQLANPNYAEVNHLVTKVADRHLLGRFPTARFIHLFRDPAQVARSELNRAHPVSERRKLLNLGLGLVGSYCAPDGARYPRFWLTGREPIYSEVPGDLTDYQHLVVQWIEIENRIDAIKRAVDDPTRIFTTPTEGLSDVQTVRRIIEFCGERPPTRVDLESRRVEYRHRNRNRTTTSEADYAEFADVVKRVPASYREIFARPPYPALAWAAQLAPRSPVGRTHLAVRTSREAAARAQARISSRRNAR